MEKKARGCNNGAANGTKEDVEVGQILRRQPYIRLADVSLPLIMIQSFMITWKCCLSLSSLLLVVL